jgi:hypothetical protein
MSGALPPARGGVAALAAVAWPVGPGKGESEGGNGENGNESPNDLDAITGSA